MPALNIDAKKRGNISRFINDVSFTLQEDQPS
jgi:hypothetical protein